MILANIFQPLIDIFGPVLVSFHSIIGGCGDGRSSR